MMTDTPESVTLVPIDRIEILNSRDRNMKVFEEIVENIRSIGLKKPITVGCLQCLGLQWCRCSFGRFQKGSFWPPCKRKHRPEGRRVIR